MKLGWVTLRCLIVDDSEEFLGAAARLLGSQGVDVVGCASSSAEALRLAETLKPDVALVDVELGDEDGVALTRQLTARNGSMRVVLISAHEQDELSELVSESAAAGLLPKTALGATAIADLLR